MTEPTAGMPMEQLILQGGALAVILFAFVFILKWTLTSFTSSLRSIEAAQYAHTLTLMAFSQLLLTHDLTASGVNEALRKGDFDEVDSKAFAKYKEIHNVFDSIRVHLSDQAAFKGKQ